VLLIGSTVVMDARLLCDRPDHGARRYEVGIHSYGQALFSPRTSG